MSSVGMMVMSVVLLVVRCLVCISVLLKVL